MSPGLNFEKFARVSKNLRKFSLSEWQFIGPMTKERNVFFRPAETAGFSPWNRDIGSFLAKPSVKPTKQRDKQFFIGSWRSDQYVEEYATICMCLDRCGEKSELSCARVLMEQ